MNKDEKPIKLPPGHVNPLEGIEMIEIYRDENTVIRANRQMNKADGEAIQRLVARLGNKITKQNNLKRNQNPAA